MYLNYYNFRKEPFQITPDPEFLFLSPSHKEAMASIIYGIQGRKGFIAILGGVGVGKTTILRSYLDKANKEEAKIVYIFNANTSFSSLLQTIFQDLDIVPGTDDNFLMVNQLHEVLIDEYKKGRTVVLIVDEAQNMPVETLESLRMLSNLETATEKLIQIVLIGQPEFDDTLNRHELRQLKQRIAIRTTIAPLDREESLRYIEHRLSKVTQKDEPVFTAGALSEIVRFSKGIPRVINVVCDNAFITGYAYQKKPVTTKIIKEVLADFQTNTGKEHEHKSERFFRWKTAGVLAILFAAIGVFWLTPHRDTTWEHVRGQVNLFKEKSGSAPLQVMAVPEQVRAVPEQVRAVPEDVATHVSPRPAAPAEEQVGEPQPARADAPLELKRSAAVSAKVERGDTLSRLISSKYGFFNKDLLQEVKRRNPTIKDVNRIYVGDIIVFPETGTWPGG
ncbi:MAG: AAA family ATPase [Syntrophorhabdales bacterium]|jgi:general secretion pathway protein A